MDWLEKLEIANEGNEVIEQEAKSVTKDNESFLDALKKASETAPLPQGDDGYDRYAKRGLIKAWSFSSLKNFEKCPMLVAFDKIDRIPQKEFPAAARGSEIHDSLEQFTKNPEINFSDLGDKKTKLIPFQAALCDLRDLYQQKVDGELKDGQEISFEENWGIRRDWSPCEWSDPEIWGRAKLDAFVIEGDGTSCRIIDYKTGRKFGNESKHADQGIGYALHAFHRYPLLDFFQVEFWYLDHGTRYIRMFTRYQLEKLLPRYDRRAHAMTTVVEFVPNPQMDSCVYCPYGSNVNREGTPYGNGHCQFDYYRG